MSDNEDRNLVCAIMYAVCASTWASTVAGAIQGCTTMIGTSRVDQLIAFLGTLHNLALGKVVLSVFSFLFLTSYFYDEWQLHNQSERDSVILLGWSFFVFQCATLNCLPCSLICGGLGWVIITWGLIASTAEKKWWLVFENIAWVMGLICLYNAHVLVSAAIMLLALISSIIHKTFRKQKGGEK